jgi:hypothetical protein
METFCLLFLLTLNTGLIYLVCKINKPKERVIKVEQQLDVVKIASKVIRLMGNRQIDPDIMEFIISTKHEDGLDLLSVKQFKRWVSKQMREHIVRTEGWYKKIYPQKQVNKLGDKLVNYGVKFDDNGEYVKHWWIIKGDIETAKNVLDFLGEPWEGVEINSPYDCTGRWFRWTADFYYQERAGVTFVKQHAGLDV